MFLILISSGSNSAFGCDVDRMWNIFNKSMFFEKKILQPQSGIGFFNQPVDEEVDDYIKSKILYLNSEFNINISLASHESANIFLFYTRDSYH